ncbi:hypothetical protein LPTSP3_g04140 [Leptospira kobayashii]|uniref:Uncharacterized protein n=1 Tax=Leptospira kobayashii TaxID=1917830 RepID=A0ABM7UG76_9LEPT|nr:hypothetical protein LPTSP3_g04140 [Leptospira kobayashii]
MESLNPLTVEFAETTVFAMGIPEGKEAGGQEPNVLPDEDTEVKANNESKSDELFFFSPEQDMRRTDNNE